MLLKGCGGTSRFCSVRRCAYLARWEYRSHQSIWTRRGMSQGCPKGQGLSKWVCVVGLVGLYDEISACHGLHLSLNVVSQ